jgi:hypothetical protein
MINFFKTNFNIESTDKVLFLHRTLPAENADIITTVEDEISEILSADEKLSDILYRYVVHDTGLLIALARTSSLQEKSSSTAFYRIPEPILIWNEFRNTCIRETAEPALIFKRQGNFSYLLWADSDNVYRVHRFYSDENISRNVMTAIHKIPQPNSESHKILHCFSELPSGLTDALSDENISVEIHSATKGTKPLEKAWLREWDFRLPEEIETQKLITEKEKTVRIACFSIGLIFVLWLAFFSLNAYWSYQGREYARKWQKISPSLSEISHLRLQNNSLISEILLSRELMDKRTNRAGIFEYLSKTKPPEVKLSELKISEKRKTVKGAENSSEQDIVSLKGYSSFGEPVAKWMETLQQGNVFGSVKLLSLGKDKGQYQFKMECEIK